MMTEKCIAVLAAPALAGQAHCTTIIEPLGLNAAATLTKKSRREHKWRAKPLYRLSLTDPTASAMVDSAIGTPSRA